MKYDVAAYSNKVNLAQQHHRVVTVARIYLTQRRIVIHLLDPVLRSHTLHTLLYQSVCFSSTSTQCFIRNLLYFSSDIFDAIDKNNRLSHPFFFHRNVFIYSITSDNYIYGFNHYKILIHNFTKTPANSHKQQNKLIDISGLQNFQ